jgi:sec-independent protein translocase protein TatB
MLRSMFGMGGTEILVILIVALLFLGPDKLPEAATKISKGIRDIKKQSRVLQQTIEEDEHIGGAIRDLKSALRGEYEPPRPKPVKSAKPKNQLVEPPDPAEPAKALPEPGTPEHGAGPDEPPIDTPPQTAGAEAGDAADAPPPAAVASAVDDAKPTLTMPPTAGEPDEDVPAASTASDDAALAAMVKPAPNTIPHKAPSVADVPEQAEQAEPKHG